MLLSKDEEIEGEAHTGLLEMVLPSIASVGLFQGVAQKRQLSLLRQQTSSEGFEFWRARLMPMGGQRVHQARERACGAHRKGQH